MITTSPRRTSRARTCISKRTRPSTPRSISCAIRRRARFSSGGTSSSSPQSPASFRSATRRNTASRCFRCARGCTSRASSSSSVWSECSTAAATSASTATISACAATWWRFSPPTRTAPRCALSCSGTRSSASAASTPSPARSTRGCSTRRFIPLRTTSRASRSATRRCATSRTNWPSASPSLKRAASLSRRSASASACCSTSSRSAKSASATGWRTIPACWPDASRAASRIRCWTISRRIF